MINLWLARYFINFATTFYNLKPLFVWIDLFVDSHQKKKKEKKKKKERIRRLTYLLVCLKWCRSITVRCANKKRRWLICWMETYAK